MTQAFENELEQIVGQYARELTREITAVILRRLGVDSTPAPSRTVTRAAAPAHAAAPSAPRASAAPKAKGGSRRRARATSDQMSERIDRVARIVRESKGISITVIADKTGLSHPAAAAALKALKEEKRVFMGGTRRFARYAATQADADRASAEAQRA